MQDIHLHLGSDLYLGLARVCELNSRHTIDRFIGMIIHHNAELRPDQYEMICGARTLTGTKSVEALRTSMVEWLRSFSNQRLELENYRRQSESQPIAADYLYATSTTWFNGVEDEYERGTSVGYNIPARRGDDVDYYVPPSNTHTPPRETLVEIPTIRKIVVE